MSEYRFYRCEEVRCPRCGSELKFLRSKKQGDPLLMEHLREDPDDCPLAGKRFYAAPLVVGLEEFTEPS